MTTRFHNKLSKTRKGNTLDTMDVLQSIFIKKQYKLTLHSNLTVIYVCVYIYIYIYIV